MQARLGRDGVLGLGSEKFRAAHGRGGITLDKREGDGATPAGLLPLRRLFYRAGRVAKPRAAVTAEIMAPEDGWCDDPASSAYNTYVRQPFAARCEMLWRNDAAYDIVGILGWNDDPVQPGRGSAIFLHVARPDYAPTEGCLALALPDLVSVLALGLTAIEIDR